jgi:hypothetical protein
MKTILIITFLLLTLNSYTQNYNIARNVLNSTTLYIKTIYPQAFYLDDVFTLNYKDGQILMYMEESLCNKVVFIFYTNEVFYQFVEANKKHWYLLSLGKWEDIRYSKILIISDSINGINYLIIKYK